VSSSALTVWARLLLGTLARAGLRDVVVSPGSRSTPFTYAALTTPGLRCHSIADERSAGFFALGQARVTGRPTLLLCTSGSAGAHYYPAVVEAAASFTPLLVLTADRPLELSECGAPQTMDQVKLFGAFARAYFELGLADETPGALDGLERMAVQAAHATQAPLPGPVHLNARARKPLEPVVVESASSAAFRDLDERLGRPVPRVFRQDSGPSDEALSALADACQAHARGLIVCGPIPPTRAGDTRALQELSAATGYPLCVEATSQLRFDESEGPRIGALEPLFHSRFLKRLAPDLVLQFGAPPTSGAFARWLSGASVARAVVTPYGHLDPQSRARWLVPHDEFATARALARRLADRFPELSERTRAPFATEWARADARYFRLVDALASETTTGSLDEAAAVSTSIAALPRGAWLGLGNSLPVRDVDAFVPPRAQGLRVWSQRGLNGIDGLVSGALGAATAAQAPSLLLIGDVSFLHDVGGLAAAASVKTPLAIVVLDNGGGRIFDELPVAKLFAQNTELARFWSTPPEVELEHAAALYRVRYARAATISELAAALQASLSSPGVTLVHAVVEPNSARLMNAELRERLDAELAVDLGV